MGFERKVLGIWYLVSGTWYLDKSGPALRSKYQVPSTKYTSGEIAGTWPLPARTVRPWKFLHRCVVGGGFEEAKSGVEHLVLAFDVMGCTHRPSEGVWHDQCPREFHLACPVSERLRGDRHRRDPGFLDRPRYVSDRHVAHGSDGDEEHQVDNLCLYPFQPPWDRPAKPAVGCCSRVRVEDCCQRANPAISVGLTQSVDG